MHDKISYVLKSNRWNMVFLWGSWEAEKSASLYTHVVTHWRRK